MDINTQQKLDKYNEILQELYNYANIIALDCKSEDEYNKILSRLNELNTELSSLDDFILENNLNGKG